MIEYHSLDEVRLNDATVHQMLRAGQPLTSIIVALANEKASLMRELGYLKMTQRPPVMVLHPDGRITPQQPIHIPQIPPHIPQ